MDEATDRRTALIEEHMARVSAAVGSFLRRNPEFSHLADDLNSAGTIGLINGVDRYLSGKVKQLVPYLRLCIYSSLWDSARTEQVIQSPRYCGARRRLGGLADAEGTAKSGRQEEIERAIVDACRDETDRMIASMSLSGKTGRGIAKEIMLPLRTVLRRKRDIARRVKAKLC